MLSSFGSFWSVKYLDFSPKATDSDSRGAVTKNLYYI